MKRNTVFVYPTETSYGIGCDAREERAVARIFAIKNRPEHKTVIVVGAQAEVLRPYIAPAVWKNPRVQMVIKKFWPGALTLVLPVSKYAEHHLARGVVAHDGTIALRVSAHPTAQAIVEIMGGPIVSTSANTAGQVTCFSVAAVKKSLAGATDQPDIFFDVGTLPRRQPSTIARWEGNGWRILRQGGVHLN